MESVSKRYGARTALQPTTLNFETGRTTVLLGPSGCGKSTLLRLILGLLPPDSGEIRVDGRTVSPATAETLRRRIGYVIQDGGLFPHLTVEGNAALMARFLRWPPERIRERLDELLALVRLSGDLLWRHPAALSGGQRQRVSLMRALMLDPDILLLDEPLGALDPITRRELQDQLKEIFARLDKTVVLVTHDIGEAAYMADTIALMREGRVVQVGSISALLSDPAEPYVAEFLRAQRALSLELAGEVFA